MVRKLLNPLQQFCRFQVEGRGEGLEGSQANLLPPCLQIRHVVFVDSGFLCQVNLPPTAIRPQLTDAFAESNANIPCHPSYSGDSIEASSTLSYGRVYSCLRLTDSASVAASSVAAYRCSLQHDAWFALIVVDSSSHS